MTETNHLHPWLCPQRSLSQGEEFRSTKPHTRNPVKGPGRPVSCGDIQGGFLEEGCLNWSLQLTGLTKVEGEAFQAEESA